MSIQINEIEDAISVLEVCRYCWADQVPWDNEKISDYEAITQTIKCLKTYKESELKEKNYYGII